MQKFKYLENVKSCLDAIKSIFHDYLSVNSSSILNRNIRIFWPWDIFRPRGIKAFWAQKLDKKIC